MASKPNIQRSRNSEAGVTRREFIRQAAMSGSAVLMLGGLGCAVRLGRGADDRLAYGSIVVDYDRCAGCRACEAICAAYNHPVKTGGRYLPGLGNPHLANIRVHSFNPDVDVPAVCAMCPDAPCIAACPVESDPKTDRRALYRHEKTLAVVNDTARCIGCGSCAEACRNQRLGVIVSDPETGRPERMCTLCDGDPQCVKHCPYEALTFQTGPLDQTFFGMPPEAVARELMKRWYSGRV